jgi:hypothetical protein
MKWAAKYYKSPKGRAYQRRFQKMRWKNRTPEQKEAGRVYAKKYARERYWWRKLMGVPVR